MAMAVDNSPHVSTELFDRTGCRSLHVPPATGGARSPFGQIIKPHRLTMESGPGAPAMTVGLCDAIDAGTLAAADSVLTAALGRLTGAVREVVIDLSAVDFISAAGIGCLLRFVEAATARNAVCTVVGGTAVARPVQLLALRPLLPVYATSVEARAASAPTAGQVA